ncbi:MAG: hypothetical protein QUV10_07825 [Paracoccaceae bacterium]|uniref:hypothetical protein n=1 Tax=unclassified Seohaeicola TaxID=2641111 RepID=UPI00237A5CD9|nr:MULTISPECIES: hypothetical protein [unclassified Seohaeicola]MDD9708252.1 hypothetical protein [Seohaeicola sp. 4SK31]MDD9736350.1 hypothetical protein [Seohaeicola sp. SP36]MDM7969514.1 hypothetical protein [Paracoccaceae bacterium]
MTDHRQHPPETDPLEDFFGAARRMAPEPSPALMARVLEDARAVQATSVRGRVARPGLLAQLREALGGWPAIGGLATAGVMGLAIGIGAATGLGDLTAALLGQPGDAYLVDLMPELDFDIAMDLSEG